MFSERKRPATANDNGRIGLITSNKPSDCTAIWNGTHLSGTIDVIGCGVPFTSSGRWQDGRAWYGVFYTILPPNGPSCSANNQTFQGNNQGFYTANSNHAGGVNVAFADGSVRFIPNSIDTGSLTTVTDANDAGNTGTFAGPSPFGVWGALGTISGGEVFSGNGF
jgi:prepilin-type processing-associated H-X9-DG protein